MSVLANIVGRDLRSTTGSNLKLVEESSGLNPWIFDSSRVKKELIERETAVIPDQDSWRISYLKKLLEERHMFVYSGEVDMMNQVSDLIDSVCIN